MRWGPGDTDRTDHHFQQRDGQRCSRTGVPCTTHWIPNQHPAAEHGRTAPWGRGTRRPTGPERVARDAALAAPGTKLTEPCRPGQCGGSIVRRPSRAPRAPDIRLPELMVPSSRILCLRAGPDGDSLGQRRGQPGRDRDRPHAGRAARSRDAAGRLAVTVATSSPGPPPGAADAVRSRDRRRPHAPRPRDPAAGRAGSPAATGIP